MKKIHRKSVVRARSSKSGISFFENDTDGRLRLAACAFIAIGISFFLWQVGMLPGAR